MVDHRPAGSAAGPSRPRECGRTDPTVPTRPASSVRAARGPPSSRRRSAADLWFACSQALCNAHSSIDQQLTRLRSILVDLRDHRIQRLKFQFRSQELHALDGDFAAIQIADEIENMDLEPGLRAPDGGPRADA